MFDHLRKKVASENPSVAPAQHNPFELLQRRPLNYLGQMSAAQAAAVPAGSWVFDPICVCVGYLPIYAEWFASPSGDGMAWYQVSGAPGPLQVTPKEAYVWQEQVMN